MAMDENSIDTLLQQLSQSPWGWRGPLPKGSGTFLGRSLTLVIDTRPFAEEGPPPPVNEAERDLVRLILPNLPQVLAAAEERLSSRFMVDDPALKDHVAAPEVWLMRESREEDGPTRWTLVVGRDDAPDFGYHLEFDGLTCTRAWAGD